MSGQDPEVEESLRATVVYQSTFIKQQAKKIDTALDLLEQLALDLDQEELLPRVEYIMKVLLDGE